MNEISLDISVQEGRLIFQALAELPFKLVFELIGKLNNQSNRQRMNPATSRGVLTLRLNKTDLETITQALSKQPFEQVNKIMGKIYKKTLA